MTDTSTPAPVPASPDNPAAPAAEPAPAADAYVYGKGPLTDPTQAVADGQPWPPVDQAAAPPVA